jgi:pre-mRNA-splicing factor CDC5/CEF1
MQRGLPRSAAVDFDAMLKNASEIEDPIKAAIAWEAALLEANDALKYPVPGAKVRGVLTPLTTFDDDALAQARLQIAREVPEELAQKGSEIFQKAWADAKSSSLLPGLSGYEDEIDEHQMLVEAFDVSIPPTNSFL